MQLLRAAALSMTMLLSVAALVRSAEVSPPNPVPRASLVTVTHDGYAWVWVIHKGKIKTVKMHSCEKSLIFSARYDSYLVFGIENEKQFQFTVEVGGEGPDPDPDPDPPDPDPDPNPGPVPDEVLRKLGIGPTAYRLAVEHGAGSDIKRLADGYLRAAEYLHEMRLTPDQAQSQLRELRAKLPDSWNLWERGVEPLVVKAVQSNPGGQLLWRDIAREIGVALRAAAKTKGVRTSQVPAVTPRPVVREAPRTYVVPPVRSYGVPVRTTPWVRVYDAPSQYI